MLSMFMALAVHAAPVMQVAPSATDPRIQQITGPHLVMTPEVASDERRLLITLGGTNSTPSELLEFQSLAARLGYHVLAIDYPNRVITTVCRQGGEHDCFDDFRSEIAWGVDESRWVDVNPANCVVARIETLLDFLRRQKDGAEWSRYLVDGQVQWSRVVLAGHSQGSGHAAFLAKHYPVDRVILLAGPQDVAAWGMAEWLSLRSATSADRFFGFVHAQDVFGSELQIRALKQLMSPFAGAVARVGEDVPAETHARILVSDLPETNAHMAPLSPRYRKVWDYLLRPVENSAGL